MTKWLYDFPARRQRQLKDICNAHVRFKYGKLAQPSTQISLNHIRASRVMLMMLSFTLSAHIHGNRNTTIIRVTKVYRSS